MDAAIDSMAKGFATVVSGLVLALAVVVTLAFGYALLSDPSRLTEAWLWVRSLPLLIQLLMWALLLPWMAALWVWSLPWPLWLRITSVIAIVAFTDFILFPAKR
jgi:NADH:ubiquinone oxidoreductase subunit 6 (subunit J)